MPALPRLILVLLLAAAATAATLSPSGVRAQGNGAVEQPALIDYEEWEKVARRAEEAVETAAASTEALEVLRASIVTWRERFFAAQSINAARIATLRQQIEALGPVPEEGASEAGEIAERRADLSAQLAEALAPVRRAEEAFRRAEGIIRQIDAIIRARQADKLLELGPSPANPAIWPGAIADFVTSVTAVYSEVRNNLRTEAAWLNLKRTAPQTLFYLAVALLLVVRGRKTMVWLTEAVLTRSKGRARYLAAFLTSLFQVVVPVLGIVLLAQSLKSTGLLGIRGVQLVDTLRVFGIFAFGARWVGLRLYPKHDDAPRPMPSSHVWGREMRFYITTLGLLLGTMIMLQVLARFEDYPAETEAVLFLPIYVLCGLLFWRLGRVLNKAYRRVREDPDQELNFAQRGQRVVGQLLAVVGIAAPVAALVGYRSLADQMVMPTALSLALLAVLRVLHDIVVEIWGVLTRQTHDEARQALTPTMISFILVIVAMPLFALIWGARVADLTEIWAGFQEGFTIGEARISPSILLTFLVIFAMLYAGTRMFQGALKSTILPKTKIDQGGQNAIVSFVGYLGIGLAVVIAVTTAGIDLSALAIVAGALSVGIGFGLQNIVSNFISGIILLVERPVAEGDWIEVGGHMGIVKDISIRSTRIETFDKNDVFVPNADFISGSVKNWTRGNVQGRIIIPVGVAYGSDTRKVQEILLEIIQNHPLVAITPEPAVDFLEFGASSLDFQIRAILPDIGHGMAVRTEIRHQIAERFAAEGIEIPFAQQDIWIRNAEVLRGPPLEPETEAMPEAGEDSAPSDSGETSGDSA